MVGGTTPDHIRKVVKDVEDIVCRIREKTETRVYMLLTGLELLRIGNHSKFVQIDERCNGVLKDNSQGLINPRKDTANKTTGKEYLQETKALGINKDTKIGERVA